MTTEMIDMIRLGREIINDGRLKGLRERLNFSRNLMSELFHVTPVTYTRWENGRGENLRPLVAERIGRFYVNTNDVVDTLTKDGISIGDLVPFHLVAAAMGIPGEVLMGRYRDGEFEAVDLGILGLWLHREDLVKLGVEDQ